MFLAVVEQETSLHFPNCCLNIFIHSTVFYVIFLLLGNAKVYLDINDITESHQMLETFDPA